MRIKYFFPGLNQDAEVIAYFGAAKLVRTLDGKYELVGGSNEDHTEAKEWISMFLHEVVPRVVPRVA